MTSKSPKWYTLITCLLFLGFAGGAMAANDGLTAFTVTENPQGGQQISVTLQVLAIMTMLTFLPAMLMMTTCFTRVIVVLAILRQAMGLQQTPSNQIVLGIALFLSFFIMAPVFDEINRNALQPYINDELPPMEAFYQARKPLEKFMLEHTRLNDLEMFAKIAGYEKFDSPADVPFSVLVPSFVTSELKTAFQIGFILFIPFLVIDIVIASILMTMGMMMLSPLIISLPFKIMLFVLVDGWVLVMGTLASSYNM